MAEVPLPVLVSPANAKGKETSASRERDTRNIPLSPLSLSSTYFILYLLTCTNKLLQYKEDHDGLQLVSIAILGRPLTLQHNYWLSQQRKQKHTSKLTRVTQTHALYIREKKQNT